MNRLPLELNRLYGVAPDAVDADADGKVGLPRVIHAGVLEVTLPAGWEQLSTVWRGVQSDLDLPAPAIAVSGVDGLQLWFSFASPIASSVPTLFLERLRRRYLGGVPSTRVRLFAEAAGFPPAPFSEIGVQRWSAFVTADLVSVFAETPWLDIPPTDEGQATILRALEPMRRVALEAALSTLDASGSDAHPETAASTPPEPTATERAGDPDTGPARFLANVMNDETAPLALRIEAARILLPYAKGP